jgi:hypothetical protein
MSDRIDDSLPYQVDNDDVGNDSDLQDNLALDNANMFLDSGGTQLVANIESNRFTWWCIYTYGRLYDLYCLHSSFGGFDSCYFTERISFQRDYASILQRKSGRARTNGS